MYLLIGHGMAITMQLPICVSFLPSAQAKPKEFEHVRFRFRLPMVVPQVVRVQALQEPQLPHDARSESFS